MRLIDADTFEKDMIEILLPKLTERYGKEEALNGLHFSFRDCLMNLQMQDEVNAIVLPQSCHDFSYYLKKQMDMKGITIRQLSEKIYMSFNAVWKWTRGDSLPGIDKLLSICEALGCTPNDLLGWEVTYVARNADL